MINSEFSIMAAQYRLSCPVRCAAISPGPILPTSPKPPQARRPAERRPRTYFHYRVSFPHITLANPLTFTAEQPLVLRSWCGAKRMILQNKPNLQKCETNRNLCPERTYETATAHNSRKNKANLQKCKNEPNPLSKDDL